MQPLTWTFSTNLTQRNLADGISYKTVMLIDFVTSFIEGVIAWAQPCFAIWAVDPLMVGKPKRIAVMPWDLLTGLFGIDDDDNRFASLRCVGNDGMVYVFNEDHHKGYPACVCQIEGKEMDQCSWRRVPPLPGPVNRFHKTIAFCSPVPLGPVFRTANL